MLESFTQIKKVAIFGSVRKNGFSKALKDLFTVLENKSVDFALLLTLPRPGITIPITLSILLLTSSLSQEVHQ